MRFSAIHKLTSYLMVLSAVAALLLSPEISVLTAALTLLGIAVSWFVEPARFRVERYTAVWNVATTGVFLYLITDVFRGGSVITSGASFLLFVLLNKLFNRRTSKDYQQAYVVAFLILVVATTLNTNITYAICFALFILFTTWTLTLLHLRREMEENYLLKHSDDAQSEKVEVERILNSRRIVGGAFLAGTSLVSLGIIVCAALIFTLFPRIGFGLFLGHKRGGLAMVGFSERVELGHHGVVRDNPQVVMRVVFPDGKPRGALRWRGSAFDHYEGGVWSHGPLRTGRTRPVTLTDGMYIVNNHAPGLPLGGLNAAFVREHLLRQEIYLEPLDSTVIFAADRPVAVEVPRPVVGGRPFFVPRRGQLGEIRAAKMRTAGVRYWAYSHGAAVDPALLRRSPPIRDPRLARFLQLPSGLPARIGELAQRVAGERPTVYEKVVAVERYLRSNYRYTLRLSHDRRLDPVDEFLFVTRQGHCEYYASAMTLMLRQLGIHARNVNGFAGGEWNGIGDYLAVRQGDAHAWVEVLFAGVGWVAFDPTPAGAQPAPGATAGILNKLGQLWDSIRLRWFRYVVEYDLGKQVSLVQGVRKLFRRAPGSPGDSWLSRHWRSLLGAGAALLALAWLASWSRRRRTRGADGAPRRLSQAAGLYQRLLKTLAAAGYVKGLGVTPREFAGELAAEGFGGAMLVERFTRCYYEVRYGGQQLTPERSQELAGILREVQHRLRRQAGGKR